MPKIEPLYTASATATGGREGKVVSTDGVLNHPLAIPKGLGGPGGSATNPEQLFAAGYAACFESAVRFVAREKKIPIKDSSVTANVSIGKNPEARGFALAVALRVNLPGVDRAQAQDLVNEAHYVCPYSHATRGNVDVNLSVE